MSVASLQIAAVKTIIGHADATEITIYKAAITDRENELIQEGWQNAMAATVAELRIAPGFAEADTFAPFFDSMHFSEIGRNKLFMDADGNKYHVWYHAAGSDVRIRRVTDVESKKMTLSTTRMICTCTGDMRAVPLSIIDFSYALITVDLDKMIEYHRKK
jgi:hypothetical protein